MDRRVIPFRLASGQNATLRHRLDAVGALRFCERVARSHATSIEQVAGGLRYKNIVAARHEMIAVVHDTLGLSLPQTGILFGMDHTSVLHALDKRRRAFLDKHPRFASVAA